MSNKQKYNSSAAVQRAVPIFFQTWWLDVACKKWDVAIAEGEDGIVAVLPYQIERKLGLMISRNPLLAPYGGPYVLKRDESNPSGLTAEILQQLWSQMPSWDSMDILTTTEFTERQFFIDLAFTESELTTYCLSLAPPADDIFRGINSNYRNLIRQAEKIYQVDDREASVDDLIKLHEATFSRKNKKYPFNPSDITALVQESYKRKQGRILSVVESDNTTSAAIFIVWDERSMYLLISAMDAARAHPGAIRLLIWESIKLAKHIGLTLYDFEGSMDVGIAAFFKRFGSEKRSYFHFSKVDSRIWKLKKQLLG